jgi:hypothetical protein
MGDDFWSCSEREGRVQLGIDGLGDPDNMRILFTRANPALRVQMLQQVENRLAGQTFARSEVREVAKLNRLRRELNERHRTLLRYGR